MCRGSRKEVGGRTRKKRREGAGRCGERKGCVFHKKENPDCAHQETGQTKAKFKWEEEHTNRELGVPGGGAGADWWKMLTGDSATWSGAVVREGETLHHSFVPTRGKEQDDAGPGARLKRAGHTAATSSSRQVGPATAQPGRGQWWGRERDSFVHSYQPGWRSRMTQGQGPGWSRSGAERALPVTRSSDRQLPAARAAVTLTSSGDTPTG
jgi:hypothetical protein